MKAGRTFGRARRSNSASAGAVPGLLGRKEGASVLRSALVLTALTVYGLPAVAGPPVSERNRTVDDVVQAFDSLTHHGEWMGFHHGAGAPVRENLPAAAWDGFCTGRGNHIQGIARSPRIGVPYFYVCSAGSFEDSESETGPSDANIMVVKMYSRDEDGERLRSNRLKRGYETSCTEPPSINDIVVKNIMSPNLPTPGRNADGRRHPGRAAGGFRVRTSTSATVATGTARTAHPTTAAPAAFASCSVPASAAATPARNATQMMIVPAARVRPLRSVTAETAMVCRAPSTTAAPAGVPVFSRSSATVEITPAASVTMMRIARSTACAATCLEGAYSSSMRRTRPIQR